MGAELVVQYLLLQNSKKKNQKHLYNKSITENTFEELNRVIEFLGHEEVIELLGHEEAYFIFNFLSHQHRRR